MRLGKGKIWRKGKGKECDEMKVREGKGEWKKGKEKEGWARR